MSVLLLVFLMTSDGLKVQQLKEPDMQTCELRAMDLNALASVRADCVEVVK